MISLYIFILIIFFMLSFFFSGIETGLVSIDRFKLEQDAKNDKQKKEILLFFEDSDKIFGTILIGNNVANVIIASLSTLIIVDILKMHTDLSTLIIAGMVLIFGELIPKSLFRDYSETLVPLFFPFFKFCYYSLKPFVFIVSKFNDLLKKVFKIYEFDSYHFFTKDDVAFILSQTVEEDEIEMPQKEMLEDALEFNELKARNIMIPRTDIVAISDTATVPELLKLAQKEGYTRYPVFHDTLDQITGVLIIYDLIAKLDQPNCRAKDIQRQVFFAPEMMDADNLLKDMQSNKRSMAVIVDSYGGTAGIVTIEDILEEIVGEIEDEYDDESERDIEIVNHNTLIIKGDVDVDHLNDEFELSLPKGDYETIAGLVIDVLAKIPTQGQIINEEEYRIEVIHVTNRRIERVKLINFTPGVNYTKSKTKG